VEEAFGVVKDHHHLGLQEEEVREGQVVGLEARQLLVVADEVVGGVPHHAAKEGGKVRVALQRGENGLVKGTQGVFGGHRLAVYGEDPVLEAEGAPRPHAHDGEAALPPSFHRLQEEAHGGLLRKLQVGGHRGLQVRQQGSSERSYGLHAVP
jgi:hypothetical protein